MDRDELLERAAFGQNVQSFWDSDVGSYLRNRAREVYTTALEGLKSVDPMDYKKVATLQAEVFKGESFERWLSEAILDGLKALDLIEGDDENVG